MVRCIGIRKEDKGLSERRVPLGPEHVRQLVKQGIQVVVAPSRHRIFPDQAYLEAGASLDPELSGCGVILGVKEIPPEALEPELAYVYFSHVIKGQEHNMPMLARLLELGCTLIDYEMITDAEDRRLVFFGRHAGLAGMIDTLWALGQRLAAEGLPTPLAEILPAHRYTDLESAKQAIAEAGRRFVAGGLPRALDPFVCGFAGYGNVSLGAQEIFDCLPNTEVGPEALGSLEPASDRLFKVVFKEEHLVVPRQAEQRFELQDYYDHPERYEGSFERYLPHLCLLVNAVYWDERYPRLVTEEWTREAWSASQPPRLRVIGDISCDIEGSIQLTRKVTDQANPVFVYEAETGRLLDGVEGRGPVVLAVDNLPAELPAEASRDFGATLLPLLPAVAALDTSRDWEDCGLPGELRRAVIAWRGKLTPDFAYIEEHL